MLHKNIIDAIGNTPLVQIPFLPSAPCYAKLEHLNPGGSIKDRSALYMIEEAERQWPPLAGEGRCIWRAV